MAARQRCTWPTRGQNCHSCLLWICDGCYSALPVGGSWILEGITRGRPRELHLLLQRLPTGKIFCIKQAGAIFLLALPRMYRTRDEHAKSCFNGSLPSSATAATFAADSLILTHVNFLRSWQRTNQPIFLIIHHHHQLPLLLTQLLHSPHRILSALTFRRSRLLQAFEGDHDPLENKELRFCKGELHRVRELALSIAQ